MSEWMDGVQQRDDGWVDDRWISRQMDDEYIGH